MRVRFTQPNCKARMRACRPLRARLAARPWMSEACCNAWSPAQARRCKRAMMQQSLNTRWPPRAISRGRAWAAAGGRRGALMRAPHG
eukprot:14179174-Alexandrium_andersonii.AAC.1